MGAKLEAAGAGGARQIAPDAGQQPGSPGLGAMLLCHLAPEGNELSHGLCGASILQTRLPTSSEARASRHPTVSPATKAGHCCQSTEPQACTGGRRGAEESAEVEAHLRGPGRTGTAPTPVVPTGSRRPSSRDARKSLSASLFSIPSQDPPPMGAVSPSTGSA